MENKESQSAEEHYKFLMFLLSVFGKNMSNVVALVANNFNTNRKMSCRIGPTFVACHNHWFSFYIQ